MLTFAKTHVDARLPERGTNGSAGLDVYSVEDQWILPNSTIMIDTGLKLADCPENIYLRVAPRSSLAMKGIQVFAGVIDSDYRGAIKVILSMGSENNMDMMSSCSPPPNFQCLPVGKLLLEKGSKICQLIPERHEHTIHPILVSCEEIRETDRGEGGFGSTNQNT